MMPRAVFSTTIDTILESCEGDWSVVKFKLFRTSFMKGEIQPYSPPKGRFGAMGSGMKRSFREDMGGSCALSFLSRIPYGRIAFGSTIRHARPTSTGILWVVNLPGSTRHWKTIQNCSLFPDDVGTEKGSVYSGCDPSSQCVDTYSPGALAFSPICLIASFNIASLLTVPDSKSCSTIPLTAECFVPW